MAAVTRLGLYGGSRSPYGSFAGKTPGGGTPYVKTFTRLGLYGGTRSPYGSFAGKSATAPAVPSAITGRVKKRKRYVIEVDKKYFEVSSIAEAESVLAQVREIAQQAAEQTVTTEVAPIPPRVSIKTISGAVTTSKVLKREVKRTQSVITKAYANAAKAIARRREIDEEISQILQTKFRDEDDEDAILALLL